MNWPIPDTDNGSDIRGSNEDNNQPQARLVFNVGYLKIFYIPLVSIKTRA